MTDEVEEGYVPETDLDQLIPDAPEYGQYGLETGEEEAPETDLDLPEVEAPAPIEMKDDIVSDPPTLETTENEHLILKEMEEIGEVSTSDEGSSDEGIVARDEAIEKVVLAPAIKKPTGPPVNVIMTTKDLMAMYRTRREQNNLHGKK